MSLRLAAYAVCIEDERALLACCASPDGEHTWTLPEGGVDHGEDPFHAVVRLRRWTLVDIGLALARTLPAAGHVDPVPVGGLLQH